MLHDRHQLNGVVAQVLDTRQNRIGELAVGGDAIVLAGHPHVRFVDERRLVVFKVPVRPGIRRLLVPYLTAPALRHPVLRDPPRIQRDVLRQHTVVFHDGDDPASLVKRLARQKELPVPAAFAGKGMGGLVPAVEIARKIYVVRARRPFAVDETARNLVEPVPLMRVGEIL